MSQTSLSSFSNNTNSLDDQYFSFRNKTQAVFDQYPQLVPLRSYIFKDLLVKGTKPAFVDILKQVLRPLKSHSRTAGNLQSAEVIIWLENDREVILDTLLPVYVALEERGVHSILLSYGQLKTLPVPVVRTNYPARVFPPRWANKAWRSLIKIEPGLNHIGTKILFDFSCALEQSFLDEIERIINIVQPKVILSASTNMAGGSTLTVAAKRKGITSLVLQHGITQVFYTPIVADYIFTWGKTSNETLENLGVPSKQIITTGSPRHDKIGPKIGSEARKILLNTLSLPELPTFIFFSNGNDLVRNGEAPIVCAQWLESLACKFEGQINIVVRLHPMENGVLYQSCIHLYITKNIPDLSTTLEGCDWSGSLCSSVLNEALLYRKPIWQFYADSWPELADNWKVGLADRISSFSDLCKNTADLLTTHPESSSDVSERVFANHGHATLSVAAYIQDMIKEL